MQNLFFLNQTLLNLNHLRQGCFQHAIVTQPLLQVTSKSFVVTHFIVTF